MGDQVVSVAPAPARWRVVAVWALPATITTLWMITVVAGSHWDRVLSHWESSVTMVFGSFVAGSTPQGGGAVAFPVFTKLLEVPTPLARTFSLSVQAIGMTTASAIILIARRPIDRKAVLVAGSGGVLGFLAALTFLSDPHSTFWVSSMPPPYVKVTFTVMLAAMAYIVFLSLRSTDHGSHVISVWNERVTIGLFLAGVIGGVASAFTGSGVDVLLFLFVVVLCGLHPRIGVPTSILAMTATSVVGFVVLGLIDGQLNVGIDATGAVTSMGGHAVGPYPARQYDLFGLWLAAVPVIVWGAPLGAWVAYVMTERRLIAFVASMATLEVVSTAVFLDDLQTDIGLVVYGLLGLVGAIAIIRWLSTHSEVLLRNGTD